VSELPDIYKQAALKAKADLDAEEASLIKSCPTLVEEDMFSPETLAWDKSPLIDDAATMVWKQISGMLAGKAALSRIWLEKIIALKTAGRHLHEGELRWNLLVGLAQTKVAKAITVSYPVRQGKLRPAQYFEIPGGQAIPLTEAHLLNYLQLGMRPGW